MEKKELSGALILDRTTLIIMKYRDKICLKNFVF